MTNEKTPDLSLAEASIGVSHRGVLKLAGASGFAGAAGALAAAAQAADASAPADGTPE